MEKKQTMEAQKCKEGASLSHKKKDFIRKEKEARKQLTQFLPRLKEYFTEDLPDHYTLTETENEPKKYVLYV